MYSRIFISSLFCLMAAAAFIVPATAFIVPATASAFAVDPDEVALVNYHELAVRGTTDYIVDGLVYPRALEWSLFSFHPSLRGCLGNSCFFGLEAVEELAKLSGPVPLLDPQMEHIQAVNVTAVSQNGDEIAYNLSLGSSFGNTYQTKIMFAVEDRRIVFFQVW